MARGANRTTGRKRRSVTLAAAAAAAIPLIALPVSGYTATAVAADFSYFPTEPTRVLTLSLLPGGNNDDLSGVMCQAPRTCQDVVYSRLSDTEAVAILNTAVRDGSTGRQIIFAYSQGARVAARWLKENGNTEGAPTAADLSFVLMGNPSRKYGGSDRDWDYTFPDSDYAVIDVSQEYDLASDFPDDRRNWLAMMNANMAFFTTHQDYEAVDIYSEANYVWTEGNTTYVFVPTKNLPLLAPLRWFGLGFVADALNAPLKEIVDRAYDRSYLPAQPGLPPVVEPEPEVPQALTMARTVSAATADTGTEVSPGEVIDEDAADVTPSPEAADLDDRGSDVTEDVDADTDDESKDLADAEADADADADKDADTDTGRDADTDAGNASDKDRDSGADKDTDAGAVKTRGSNGDSPGGAE